MGNHARRRMLERGRIDYASTLVLCGIVKKYMILGGSPNQHPQCENFPSERFPTLIVAQHAETCIEWSRDCPLAYQTENVGHQVAADGLADQKRGRESLRKDCTTHYKPIMAHGRMP